MRTGTSTRTLQNNRLNSVQNTITSCGNAMECNHLVHLSREQKKCWHMLEKSLTGFKLDATYANIMQHSPTWCTNERNTGLKATLRQHRGGRGGGGGAGRLLPHYIQIQKELVNEIGL